ncbi:uncharacterized protein LOC34620849 [Cyclospora cayetanensis]|uniref:Uncharacterized protein LOC34620849 n=1 Tax=Cyclospora cayetanensis TaxID=88456 RepID=A0A6P6RTM4_9EIME|nr:uncharacterized protein LOC34620849 [Cyclospora cayetanensis]
MSMATENATKAMEENVTGSGDSRHTHGVLALLVREDSAGRVAGALGFPHPQASVKEAEPAAPRNMPRRRRMRCWWACGDTFLRFRKVSGAFEARGSPPGLLDWIPKEFLLIVYMASALLTGCVYFGFHSLRRMLLQSGAYAWLCEGDATVVSVSDGSESEVGALSDSDVLLCDMQDAAVSPLITVAMVSHSLMSAVAGALLDRVGPKATAMMGQGFNALGWLLLAVCNSSFPAYVPAFLCMGLGADSCYLPLLKIVNRFSARRATVISLLGVACTASFGVPMVLEAIWRMRPQWEFSTLCWVYILMGPGFCLLIAVVLVPWTAFPDVQEQEQEGEKHGAKDRMQQLEDKGHVCPSPVSTDNSINISIETSAGSHMDSVAMQSDGSSMLPKESENAQADIPAAVDTSTAGPATAAAPTPGKVVLPAAEGETQQRGRSSFMSEFLCVRYLCILILASSQQLAISFFQMAGPRLLDPPVGTQMDRYISLAFIPCILIGAAIDLFGILPILSCINTLGFLAYAFTLAPASYGAHVASLICFCGYISLDSELIFCCINSMFSSTNFGRLAGVCQAAGGIVSLSSIPLYNTLSVGIHRGDCKPVAWALTAVLGLMYGLLSVLFWVSKRHPSGAPKSAPDKLPGPGTPALEEA